MRTKGHPSVRRKVQPHPLKKYWVQGHTSIEMEPGSQVTKDWGALRPETGTGYLPPPLVADLKKLEI